MTSVSPYFLGESTLSPAAILILFFYGVSLGLEIGTVLYTLGGHKLLPRRFRRLGLLTIGSIGIGFLICTVFLFTDQLECTLFRKIAYVFIYLGFLVYDYYQMIHVIGMTKPETWKRWCFYAMFLIRVGSSAVNVWYVEGVVIPNPLSKVPGAGPCKSKFHDFDVYQEHIIIILFEMGIMSQVLWHAHQLMKVEKRPINDIIKKVFNFETISFFCYMLAEMGYLLCFVYFDRGMVSLLNTFYINLPVILYIANSCVFMNLKLKCIQTGSSSYSFSIHDHRKDTESSSKGAVPLATISASPVLLSK
jgi:fumarate reductase subunit C